MRSTVETQLLSNEMFGNRSSENVPLNLNLLVCIFSSYLCQYLFLSVSCVWTLLLIYSCTVTFERNSVCYIRFSFPLQCIIFRSSFPLPLFFNSVPICFMTFYQKLQTKINAISISHVFVACTSRFSFFYIRSFYNREPPQERERHKNHYFRLASLLAYENIRFSTLFAAGDVSRPQRRRARRN